VTFLTTYLLRPLWVIIRNMEIGQRENKNAQHDVYLVLLGCLLSFEKPKYMITGILKVFKILKIKTNVRIKK
jgi:hypothetical protein